MPPQAGQLFQAGWIAELQCGQIVPDGAGERLVLGVGTTMIVPHVHFQVLPVICGSVSCSAPHALHTKLIMKVSKECFAYIIAL